MRRVFLIRVDFVHPADLGITSVNLVKDMCSVQNVARPKRDPDSAAAGSGALRPNGIEIRLRLDASSLY